MPLSKARDRERKRLSRLDILTFQPKLEERIAHDRCAYKEEHGIDPCFDVQPSVPLYNSMKHKAGDTVMLQGKVVTIPELDGDGNVVPAY